MLNKLLFPLLFFTLFYKNGLSSVETLEDFIPSTYLKPSILSHDVASFLIVNHLRIRDFLALKQTCTEWDKVEFSTTEWVKKRFPGSQFFADNLSLEEFIHQASKPQLQLIRPEPGRFFTLLGMSPDGTTLFIKDKVFNSLQNEPPKIIKWIQNDNFVCIDNELQHNVNLLTQKDEAVAYLKQGREFSTARQTCLKDAIRRAVYFFHRSSTINLQNIHTLDDITRSKAISISNIKAQNDLTDIDLTVNFSVRHRSVAGHYRTFGESFISSFIYCSNSSFKYIGPSSALWLYHENKDAVYHTLTLEGISEDSTIIVGHDSDHIWRAYTPDLTALEQEGLPMPEKTKAESAIECLLFDECERIFLP